MRRNVEKRIARLENAVTGNWEAKRMALSRRLGVAPERWSTIDPKHYALLSKAVDRDGGITWEGFCHLYQLGLFDSTQDRGGAPPSDAAALSSNLRKSTQPKRSGTGTRI